MRINKGVMFLNNGLSFAGSLSNLLHMHRVCNGGEDDYNRRMRERLWSKIPQFFIMLKDRMSKIFINKRLKRERTFLIMKI